MAADSLRVELGATYTLLFLAAEASLLAQAIGVTPVRIVTVADGGGVPSAASENYFVIDSARGASDSIVRTGFEGSDIYARSDSETLSAFVTKTPS